MKRLALKTLALAIRGAILVAASLMAAWLVCVEFQYRFAMTGGRLSHRLLRAAHDFSLALESRCDG